MSQAILNSTKTTRGIKTGLQRTWYVLDASKQPIGRLASEAARLLMGKNRSDFSADVDLGGMVVIINCAKAVLTGKKPEKKNYFTHSGRVGGLKVISYNDLLSKKPTAPIYHAISGMLPKNRHRDLRLNNRLFIFTGHHNLPNKMIPAN
ncbi:MAG: 50S ribosomal protein L13 [Patescibacteria group bacterium]